MIVGVLVNAPVGHHRWKRRSRAEGVGPVLAGVLVLFALASPALATQIGANFSNNTISRSLGAAEIAGATGFRQANWNQFFIAGGSASDLVDDQGNATTADLTWSGNGHNDIIFSPSTPDSTLMSAHIRSTTGAVTASVSQISFATYSVVVYFDAFNGANEAIHEVAVGGTTLFGRDAANATFPNGGGEGDFALIPTSSTVDLGLSTPTGNYMVAGLSGDTVNVSVDLAPSSTADRISLTAIQVVEIPEPAPLVLAVLGLLGVGLSSSFSRRLRLRRR